MIQEHIELMGPNAIPLEFGVTLIDTHLHTFAILTDLNCNQGGSIAKTAEFYINQANEIYGLNHKETIYINQYGNIHEISRMVPYSFEKGACLRVRWEPLPDNIEKFIQQHMRLNQSP